jgi:hypothetical protein
MVVAVLAGCGSNQTSATPAIPSSAASAAASPSASALAPSPSATASASASASVAPQVVEWKRYKSARYHYTLQYPPDWVVTPGSARLPDSFDNFRDFIYVSRTTISGRVSLGLTVTFETNYMKSHYRAKLLTSASLTAARWPAKLLTFTATRDSRRFFVQELIVVKGNTAYFLVWWSDRGNAASDRKAFKAIFSTFRRT